MASLTPNLKLFLGDDLTSAARSNLNKIDALGGSTLVDNTSNLRIRSSGDIQLQPNSSDIGGTGSGGSVVVGENGTNISSFSVYADSFQLNGSDIINSVLVENNLDIGNSSDLRTSVDTNLLGDILADTTTGLTIKSGAITNASINNTAAISLSKLSTITASRAIVSDGSGVISPSAVTSTELGYLSGVTSNIQTQINALGGANQLVSTWSNSDGSVKTITHNFGTRNVIIQVLDDNNSYINIDIDSITRPTDNTAVLTSSQAPVGNWTVLLTQIGS